MALHTSSPERVERPMTEVPWPKPPREPGPWAGGPPVAPPGNTALPPLPGPGGVVGGSHGTNPWAAPPSPDGPDAPRTPPPVAPFPGLAQRVTLVDRAPRSLVAVSVVVVVALLAGLAYVVLEGGQSFPSKWDPRVAAIAEWVSDERDLDYAHPVEVEFLTSDEYSKAATGGDQEESEEEKRALDDAVAELRALGLVEGDVDLGEASDTLSDAGTLAYYSPQTKKVYVRGTEMTPALRVTLAHELTHVLQDQHFDLSRMSDLPDGQAAAMRAVAEGDAERIEDTYIADVLSDNERDAYEKANDDGGKAMDEIDEKVPPAMTALFAAPYVFGPRLVAFLRADDDDAIDAALKDPPTEEVLFDPRQFGKDSAGHETIELEPPSGAEELETGDVGQTVWYLLLASRLDPKVALQAVDGIGDDGYVMYRGSDRKVCVQMAAAGDTPADLAELTKALQDWSAQSPPKTSSVEAGDQRVTVTSCDPGTEAKAVGKATSELFGLPSGRSDIYNSVLEAGGTKKQADCFAQGVVDRLSYDQIVGPESPEVAAIVQDVGVGCR